MTAPANQFGGAPNENMICMACRGSGRVIDPRKVGARLRDSRKQREISLREMARRLGITAPYLSDMELGRRGWSTKWIQAFEKALK